MTHDNLPKIDWTKPFICAKASGGVYLGPKPGGEGWHLVETEHGIRVVDDYGFSPPNASKSTGQSARRYRSVLQNSGRTDAIGLLTDRVADLEGRILDIERLMSHPSGAR